MSKTDNLIEFLTSIANVIREKKGTSDLINPQRFREEIENLSSEQPQLYAPTIELSDAYLNIINNANNGDFVEYFDVYVNGTNVGSVVGTESQCAWGEYVGEPGAITVAARGTYFIDSGVSNEVSVDADLIGGLYSADGSFTSWNRLVSDGVVTMDGTTITSVDDEISGSLVLPNNGNVVKIGTGAFNWCEVLTSIKIPTAITSIGERAFANCTNLTSIDISDNIERIYDDAFLNCSSLNYNEKDGIKYLGNATNLYAIVLEANTSLVSVTLPESVVHVYKGAFNGCNRLTNITMPFVGMSKYTITNGILGHMFGTDNHTLHADYVPSSLKIVNLTSATLISSYAFDDCTNLTSITIPDSVTSIGNYAFESCTGLTNMVIPDSVTEIGTQIFYGCNNLSHLTTPILNNKTISSFMDSTSASYLQTVIITSGESIAANTFYNCSGLTNITIPSSVTSIGTNAFYGCTGLTKIHISDLSSWCKIVFDGTKSNPLSNAQSKLYIDNVHQVVFTIPADVTGINDYTFYYYAGLLSITIPDSVTSIGKSAFYGCTSLTSITIPDSVTSIDNYAFRECSGLTSITIPSSVTKISAGMLRACTSLTTINITSNVTKINSNSFRGCTKLKKINYDGTKEQWNAIDFGTSWNTDTGTYIIYCSDGNISKS